MKTLLKTITYSSVVVMLFGLFTGTAFAQPVFNNHTLDFDTVMVTNQTNNPNSTTSWSTSTTAEPGDIVAVQVYYHNNGSSNANSTKLKINNGPVINPAFTHPITGSVTAANALTPAASTATVTIVGTNQPASLEFVSISPAWFANNQSVVISDFLFGQDGSEIFSSTGLNVGTVTPGWSSQGTVVFHYKVVGQSDPDPVYGCTDPAALNYNPLAEVNDGSCNYPEPQIQGCTDPAALNYEYWADINDGSCIYETTDLPLVITKNPGNVTEDSAELRGELIDLGGADSVNSLKFKYGVNAGNLNQTKLAYTASLSYPDDFEATVSNLQDDTEYFYRACGTNESGEYCGSIKSFTTDEEDNNNNNNNNVDLDVITKSASNVSSYQATLRGEIIDTDGEDVIRYFEYGDDEDDLDYTLELPGITDNDGNFSATLYGLEPNEKYYFRACIEAVDENEDECGSVRDFRTQNGGTTLPVPGNLQSITTFATGISGTSAVLNGVSTNNTYNGSISFFEYGTSYSLGKTTGTRSVSAGQNLYNAQTVYGLTPNTTYYYRIVTGSVPGEIKSFTTGSNTTVVVTNTTTNTTTTNTGGGEGIIYLALDIEPDFENVYEGDVINFDVDYRNLYNGELEDVVIQVMFPEEIEFRKSTQGFYSTADRALIVDLGDLEDDEEGTFLVQGEVLGRFNNQDMVVTIAEGTYDHPTIENAQGSSTAYALNTILLDRSTLGAFAFGAGFFPGLFGWLILLLLILLIVWISRRIYNDHQDRKTKQGGLQIN